ncbi:hypothetical protein HOK51_03345 [Candidatus Woesearchaeota archaeon]|mgnify:CR=1 FL=1|jgi:protein phosphatase|nr:hypothetical protein [Candidatus Woesearchaeota archaeon]MBT6518855.1 hypothetical protein [Candidatus Woesearchaeota archaeon]MBT7367994.1 hypothetical protein [Candidatus Woesearchaeota archaeon]
MNRFLPDIPGYNEPEQYLDFIKKASTIFETEPSLIELPLNKPIAFVGDTHGDFETTEKVYNMFSGSHLLVFLGDYIDRAPKENGSIKNISYLLQKKIENPRDIILLRGNHDVASIPLTWPPEFYVSLAKFEKDYVLPISSVYDMTFSSMPYVATTKNGIIGLHGAIPQIKSIDDLVNLPKGIVDSKDNKLIDDLLWSDLDHEEKYGMGEAGFIPNEQRSRTGSKGIIINEKYFEEKMKLLEKNVLLRGHDALAKGYCFNNRVLTIFTSEKYIDKGNMKGVFVALMKDPQKEIKTAKDLTIIQF